MKRRDLLKSAVMGTFGSLFMPKELFANTEKVKKIQKLVEELSKENFSKIAGIPNLVRRKLEWWSLLRRCLMSDELPQGQPPLYERNSDYAVWEGCHRGIAMVQKGENVLLPTREIPLESPSDRKNAYSFLLKNQNKELSDANINNIVDFLFNNMRNEEEAILFMLLEHAIKLNKQYIYNGKYNSSKKSKMSYINEAFAMIESHDLIVYSMIMHPDMINKLDLTNKNYLDVRYPNLLKADLSKMSKPVWGHLWTSDVLLTNNCPMDTVYLVSSPDHVGVVPIRQDYFVLPSVDNGKVTLADWEEIGAGIINNGGVSRIDFK